LLIASRTPAPAVAGAGVDSEIFPRLLTAARPASDSIRTLINALVVEENGLPERNYSAIQAINR
jgi:hypothetical protein